MVSEFFFTMLQISQCLGKHGYFLKNQIKKTKISRLLNLKTEMEERKSFKSHSLCQDMIPPLERQDANSRIPEVAKILTSKLTDRMLHHI